MGSQYNWLCTKNGCDTKIQHVSGGYDRGFTAKIQTRICTSCKLVKDYNIGVVSDSTHRVFTEAELEEHKNVDPKCNHCSGKTIAWNLECPKCGSTMKRGTVMVLWD